MLDSKDAILVIVRECAGESDFGRTSLQKVAYLASATLHWNDLGHRAYFYGPYSKELDVQATKLVEDGLIEESVQDLGFTNRSGFRGRRYHYRLTPAGEERCRKLYETHAVDVGRLQEFARHLKAVAGGYDQRVLSLAAKTHFITVNTDPPLLTVPEIRACARELGWLISPDQMTDVTDKLQKLGLVDVQPG